MAMNLNKRIVTVFLFSIAMAYLESAVVVYLRIIYYPEGFIFPIKMITDKILLIEIGREAATIIMLATIALLSSRMKQEKFYFFLLAFGVWDIFYYFWLKVFINWPQTLLTDDLLFLIPVPWIAPVLAPILVSIYFITLSIIVLRKIDRGMEIKIGKTNVLYTLIGVILILISFIWNYQERLNSASPVEFIWEIFGIGLLFMIIGGISLFMHSGDGEKKHAKT